MDSYIHTRELEVENPADTTMAAEPNSNNDEVPDKLLI